MSNPANRLVTVFGGGGFIGRYLCQQLLKGGYRLRVAEREPRRAWFLKPLGALGQTQFIAADIRRPESVAAAVAGAGAVVNLVGILRGDFEGVHVTGAANVARAAAAAGADTLVHLSAIGADPDSPSRYGSSKGRGEQAVREAFPDATIIRPSIVFGPEDDFVNRFARMARMLPVLPIVAPEARFQPVYVADLARAISAAATEPREHRGRTYELGGPQVFTMAELNREIARMIGRPDKWMVEVPDLIGGAMASATGWLPGAPITSDQWRMLQVPNVVDERAAGFDAFGIRPTPLAAVAEAWLTPYRKGGRFSVKSPY
jgi:uncharacterized protein YbjT (DUF2867 family)